MRACPVTAGSIRAMTTEPKRSQRGLFHGRTVGFGNNVSFSHRRTRRKFKPNTQHVRVWSEVRRAYERAGRAVLTAGSLRKPAHLMKR